MEERYTLTTELPEDEIERLAEKAEQGYTEDQLVERARTEMRERFDSIELEGEIVWTDRSEDGSGFALSESDDGLRFLIYAYGAILESEPITRDKVFGLRTVLDAWLRRQA